MSDELWRQTRAMVRHTPKPLLDPGDIIELDELQRECDAATLTIRHQFHDAHDRVTAWDLRPRQKEIQ